MDNLEQYIKDHRDELDSIRPSTNVWERINNSVESKPIHDRKGKVLIWTISKIAAAFAFVLASGVVIGYLLNDQSTIDPSKDVVFQEYLAVEKKFVKDINHKMNVLNTYDIDPQVNKDLLQLDEVYEELKEELYRGGNINNDKIIEALIMNYEVKVEILEKVLSKLQNAKEEVNLKTLRDDTLSI